MLFHGRLKSVNREKTCSALINTLNDNFGSELSSLLVLRVNDGQYSSISAGSSEVEYLISVEVDIAFILIPAVKSRTYAWWSS